MPKTSLKKYPVKLSERLTRDRFQSYGHRDVADCAAYVRKIRKSSRRQGNEAFLKEIRKWQKSNPS